MSAHIFAVTDSNFEQEVVQADKPVLVDFWAEWCGPCRALAPILEEIATDYANKLKVVKLNVDENPTYAAKFGIRSIPTLLLFREGQIIATKIGGGSKSQIGAFLKDHL